MPPPELGATNGARRAGEVGAGIAALTARTQAGAERTADLRLRAESLAATAGVGSPDGLQALEPPIGRDRLIAAHTAAASFYAEQLTGPAGAGPLRYLQSRGVAWAVTDPEWSVGYAPASRNALVNHLRVAGFTAREMTTAGLGTLTDDGRVIDRFRDRIMFGLRDPSVEGRPVIGFIGRAAPNAAPGVDKYVNSRNTPIYHKSAVLYGLAEQHAAAHAGGPAVVVEGPIDVLAVAGLRHANAGPAPIAVGTCGTALTAEHVAALTAAVDTSAGVIAAFDGDAAGRRAAERAYHLLTPAYEHRRGEAAGPVRGVEVPAGHDPASINERYGPDALTRLLDERSAPLVDLVLEHRVAAHESTLRARGAQPDTIEARVGALPAVVPLIADRPPPEVTRLAVVTARRLDLDITNVTAAIVEHYERATVALDALAARSRGPTHGQVSGRGDDGARAAVVAAATRLSRGVPVSAPPATRRGPSQAPARTPERS
jgi:DNA primase